MNRSLSKRKIEVLQFCSNQVGQKITHVISKCRLQPSASYSIVRLLLAGNLLEKVGCLYRSTEEGKRIVRLYREVEQALSELES